MSETGTGGIVATPERVAIAVTGRYVRDTSVSNMTTVAFDAATGAEVWRAIVAPAAFEAGAAQIAADADGTTIVSVGGAGERPVAIAYDAMTGAERWRHSFGSLRYGGFQRMTMSPGGAVAYAGGEDIDGRLLVLAIDTATGAVLWISPARHSPGCVVA